MRSIKKTRFKRVFLLINSLCTLLYLKYFQPTDEGYGDCYARSLYLLAGFDDAVLVRGNRKDMEIKRSC